MPSSAVVSICSELSRRAADMASRPLLSSALAQALHAAAHLVVSAKHALPAPISDAVAQLVTHLITAANDPRNGSTGGGESGGGSNFDRGGHYHAVAAAGDSLLTPTPLSRFGARDVAACLWALGRTAAAAAAAPSAAAAAAAAAAASSSSSAASTLTSTLTSPSMEEGVEGQQQNNGGGGADDFDDRGGSSFVRVAQLRLASCFVGAARPPRMQNQSSGGGGGGGALPPPPSAMYEGMKPRVRQVVDVLEAHLEDHLLAHNGEDNGGGVVPTMAAARRSKLALWKGRASGSTIACWPMSASSRPTSPKTTSWGSTNGRASACASPTAPLPCKPTPPPSPHPHRHQSGPAPCPPPPPLPHCRPPHCRRRGYLLIERDPLGRRRQWAVGAT